MPLSSARGLCLLYRPFALFLEDHSMHHSARSRTARAYQVAGPAGARPILFVHGTRVTRSMWLPQLHGLADQYRVTATDSQPYRMLYRRLSVEISALCFRSARRRYCSSTDSGTTSSDGTRGRLSGLRRTPGSN
jgi:hypothetical protein